MFAALTFVMLAQATSALPIVPAPVVAMPVPVPQQMLDLYTNICFKPFPDDAAVDAAMTKLGATPLTKQQLAIYLHQDPGHGWSLGEGVEKYIITIENPPYHACSVRHEFAQTLIDMTAYQAAAARFEAATPGFAAIHALDFDGGGVHSHLTGEQRDFADGGAEALMVVTGVPGTHSALEMRFVRQITSAPH